MFADFTQMPLIIAPGIIFLSENPRIYLRCSARNILSSVKQQNS